MNYIIAFLIWTLILYWLHRAIHITPVLKKYHDTHHAYINRIIKNGGTTTWHWSNLFLFNDNIPSTIDLWITEVIPTILFSAITGQWWLFLFYYIWAAFIQESIEHNPKINLTFLLSGHRHLNHHKNPKQNFGLFFPVWDRLFGTYIR